MRLENFGCSFFDPLRTSERLTFWAGRRRERIRSGAQRLTGRPSGPVGRVERAGGARFRAVSPPLSSSRPNIVFVDVMKDNPWALALLAVKGFQFYRSLTGMYCGENAHPGRPDLLCAILGPEFG